MRNLILLVVAALLVSAAAFAQSKEDKRASLVGIANIALKETGTAAFGGGSAGSDYLLQPEKAMKAAGIHIADYEGAAQKSIPIYETLCSSMDSGDGMVRVACEGRLVRPVNIAPDNKLIYAVTWTSPLVVAAFTPDRMSDLSKLTQKFVDTFMEDWKAANPAAPAKKKGK